MDIGFAVAGAIGIAFASTTIILLLWWYITKVFLRPVVMDNKYFDLMVEREVSNFFLVSIRSVRTAPKLLFNTGFSVFGVIVDNLFILMVLIIFASVSLIWIENHNQVLESYMVLRQCYVQEVINFFLLPTIDIVVLLYNAIIGVFNFVFNMRAFAEYGAPITLFKCALNQELGNLLFWFTDAFYAFFFDLNYWILRGATTSEWDVLTTLTSLGYVIDSLVPIMNCFCRILQPVWEAISLFANNIALHYTINCLLNTIVRLIQVIVVTLKYFISYILPGINPVRPDFTNATHAACCTLYNAGDAIEDGIYLIVELIWGLIGRDLPPILRQFLSVHYASILSHPLCGVARVINMTAVLLTNLNDDPDGFLESNGRGIRFLQFGHAVEEFKYGATKLGEPFYIFSPAAQGFVAQLAHSVVNIAAFLLEWVIGNVWFFVWSPPSDVMPSYPAPLLTGFYRYINFLFYYFPNYWLKAPPGGVPITTGTYTFSSALSQLYDDTFLLSVAAGDLVGLINNPLGCAIEHLLKTIISLISFLCNVISFFFRIFTFDTDIATTARAIETSIFFLEAHYTADCLGTILSQFGNCTETENNAQDNLFCCAGDLVTLGLDTIILTIEQIVQFFLDILTLPTLNVELCLFGAYNPSREQCARLPNLAVPIAKLNAAICAFSCAVANIIPTTFLFNGFDCVFAPGAIASDTGAGGSIDIGSLFDEFSDASLTSSGEPLGVNQCASITSCIGNLICSVLQIATVPLTILNQFFIQIIAGNPITNLFAFLNTGAGLLARATGKAADAVGILVDCAFCAFFNNGRDCSSFFYTLMHYVFVIPLVRVSVSFGYLSFYMTRIVMSGIKQIFDGAGYLGLYSIITKTTKLMGIYGEAANFWFTRVLSKMGLYLVGSTFSATNRGVCTVVEKSFNVLVSLIATFTGGVVTVPSVVMCCESSFACWPFKKRFVDGVHVDEDGNITLTPETWLRYIVTRYNTTFDWSSSDSCRTNMATFMDKSWMDLTDDQRANAYFCLFSRVWNLRTDNQTTSYLPNSTCDDAMIGLADTEWDSLRFMEKSVIANCIMLRSYIDEFREKAQIPWFPQDWWTNEYRKMHFGTELLYAARIYYQYMMDQSTSPSIILTPAYQQAWLSMSLNISHYAGLGTADDVLLMRSHYHLRDYYVWNGNATQYEPIVWFTTGIWSVIGSISDRITETSTAFSDNTTDPTIYLQYTYHTDTPGGISDGLFFDIIARVASSVSTFAKKWSNPENLKKRATFFSDAKKMGDQVYKRMNRELTRMSLEWWKSASHNISRYYGECDVNETIEFMNEYESAIRGLDKAHGQHSMLYRIGKWWDNFELPRVKRIPVQKDGKYRGGSTLATNDGHNNQNESMMERLYRYTQLVREGTVESNNRVSRLTSGFYMIRNRIYTKIIQQRIDEIREQQLTMKTTFTPQPKSDVSSSTVSYKINTRPLHTQEETRLLDELEREARGPENLRFLLNREFTTKSLIRMNGLLDLTCTSSSSILCAECFFVDQLVGRIENGIRITLGYYQGGQYDAALAETMDHFAYAFNESAPARIGDSDQLPVRWPWRYYDNLRILGDRTPNKLRFNDIINMTNNIADNFALSIENSTLYTNIDYGSANGIVISLIFSLFPAVIDFFYKLVIFVFSPTGVTDATSSISFILENWVTCDWNVGNALYGIPRFSIGEMILGYAVVYLIIYVLGNGIKISLWGILSSTGYTGLIILFTFLNVTYNWAWLCWPCQHVRLFLNINYFIIHTLLTKCEWFFSGLILGPYNNQNCYPCSFALSVTMANCKDYGFRDIFSNIIFFMEYFAPWIIQWIRDTTSPVYIIYQIPYINQRLNQFATVNMNDPDTFALYWTCATSITIVPFLIIVALFFIIFKFFTPIFSIAVSYVGIIFDLFYSAFLINYYVLESFFMSVQMYPFLMTGYTDTTLPGSDGSSTIDGEAMERANTFGSSNFASTVSTSMMMTMGSNYPRNPTYASVPNKFRRPPKHEKNTFSGIMQPINEIRKRRALFGNFKQD